MEDSYFTVFLLGLNQSNIHVTELYFYLYFCVDCISILRR